MQVKIIGDHQSGRISFLGKARLVLDYPELG